MTSAPVAQPEVRALRVYLGVLGALAVVVVAWLLDSAAAAAWSPVVVPVMALVCVAELCPVWVSTSRLRSQLLDASDVGLVVAVVLLPLPVALLVFVTAALVAVLVEFVRSPVRILYNAAHVVLTSAATGALVWWADASAAWLPWTAAAACFLVEQVVAQPMLHVVSALADGARPSWRGLLHRPAATVAVPLSTAALAGVVGAAAQQAGDGVAWPAVALVAALMLVSRARLRLEHEARRLVHCVRVLTSSSPGRGTSPVLATLDEALEDLGVGSGVRVVGADEDVPPSHLGESVPSDGGPTVRLLVRRPVETSLVHRSRVPAVQALLRAGAQAYATAQATDTLHHDAHHDGLTGLLNRAGFAARTSRELARAGRSHLSAVLVYVDLDGFKAVNDTLGHEAGDRVLVAAAAELRELVRPHDVLTRLGGDEFAVLLLDLPACEHGAGVVERVHGRLSTGWPVSPSSSALVRGSVGTACFPCDAQDLPGLLRIADARMYERKRTRRGG